MVGLYKCQIVSAFWDKDKYVCSDRFSGIVLEMGKTKLHRIFCAMEWVISIL